MCFSSPSSLSRLEGFERSRSLNPFLTPNKQTYHTDPFPVVWETEVGGNGHAYLLVEESATFAQALSGAPSYHWTGAGEGYLATITSASEQEFIYDYLNSTAPAATISTYWIGSQKTSPNNTNWLWIDGVFFLLPPPPSPFLHTQRTRRGHRIL